MRWLIGGALVFMVTAAPNLFWLSDSTVLVRNAASMPMTARLAIADDPDRVMDLGEIAPGASQFKWLHATGRAIVEIDIQDGDSWRRQCREHIKRSGYRVSIVIRSPREVTCTSGPAVLRHLLLSDYFSAL